MNGFIKLCQQQCPGLVIAQDEATCSLYGRDWTTQFEVAPLGIAFVESIEQVQTLVQLANQFQVGLVPSGGRTGLSGGAVASHQELVVSFERMNRILDFNAIDNAVTVQAGVVTEQLQNFARAQGLYYPVSFASRGSSQIGGNIATNAGGINVLRYGLTRERVSGLTVVTGRGDILSLNHGLIKNATGFDLRHLFIGSEGCLGFIVEATLQLAAAPKPTQVMVMAVNDLPTIPQLLRQFRALVAITAFEFFSDNALSYVLNKHQLPRPFDARTAYYVLMEFEQNEACEQDVMALFTRLLDSQQCQDAILSSSAAQAQALWRLREDITECIAIKNPYKNDIAVKVSAMPAFVAELTTLLNAQYPEFEVVVFGHIGDGNLHVGILKPEPLCQEDFVRRCEQANHAVFALVQKYHGSISAEHGIGLLKRSYLNYSRSIREQAYLHAIKSVFDPNGIMNPGKLLMDEPPDCLEPR